jgi:WD40 repeat protein
MTAPNKKKKSPKLFFLICFVVVLIIAIIPNRQSVLVKEISIPLNNGISKLSTCGKFLLAVSLDNKAYIIEWDNLSNKYRTIPVQSDQTVLLNNGIIVSTEKYNARSIVLTSLNGDTKSRAITLDTGEGRAFLNIGRNQNTTIATIAQAKANQQNQTTFTFYLVDPNNNSTQYLFKADAGVDINQWISVSASDDCKLISLCGEKQGRCWIALCNMKEKRIAWETELPTPVLFFNCVFSPDSKLIFARGSDSTVYKFDCSSGQPAGQLRATKDNTNTEKYLHAQSVQVSNDGSLIGAVVSSIVCIWDQNTGRKIFSRDPSHKVIIGMAFSPDSKFLATADMRQGGKIKIWRLPEH